MSRRAFLGGTAAIGAGALLAPFSFGCGSAAPRSDGEALPNILLLLSDQHRADVLGVAGNTAAVTPNLDALAARGVRFGRAYCNAPMCRPSRASILTGQYPRQHGVWTNAGALDCMESASHVRRLRDEAGYHTAMIGKGHLHQGEGHLDNYKAIMEEFGYAECMEYHGTGESLLAPNAYTDWLVETSAPGEDPDKWERLKAYLNYHLENHWLTPWLTFAPDEAPWSLSTSDHVDIFTGDTAARWIRAYDRARPFYLQVGFPGPHNPFDSTTEYRELIGPLAAGMPPALLEELLGPHSELWENARAFQDIAAINPAQLMFLRLIYYAKTAMVDAAIGQVLRALEERGLAENTWVVYCSDHGEMLGDHLLLGKGVFHEQAARVPLIIAGPAADGGWVSDGIAEGIDVAATVLDLAGLDRGDCVGESLLDRVELGPDDPGAQSGRDFAMSEFYLHGMIRTPTHKAVVDYREMAAVELYDLEADPEERENRVGDPALAGVRDELVATLVDAVPV